MGNKKALEEKLGVDGYRKYMADLAKKKWANYDPNKNPHKGGFHYKSKKELGDLARKAVKVRVANAKRKTEAKKASEG